MSVRQYVARAIETAIEDEVIAAFRPDMQAWLREQLDEWNGYAAEDYRGGKRDSQNQAAVEKAQTDGLAPVVCVEACAGRRA